MAAAEIKGLLPIIIVEAWCTSKSRSPWAWSLTECGTLLLVVDDGEIFEAFASSDSISLIGLCTTWSLFGFSKATSLTASVICKLTISSVRGQDLAATVFLARIFRMADAAWEDSTLRFLEISWLTYKRPFLAWPRCASGLSSLLSMAAVATCFTRPLDCAGDESMERIRSCLGVSNDREEGS